MDEMEQLKYDLVGQVSFSMHEVPYGSSMQFESEEVMLSTAPRHLFTTNCVWCGMEFNQDTDDSDLQFDSVGYMCPTCKDKIPG